MIDITRPGKYALTVETPVIAASGTMGYGAAYDKLVELDKLGAVVTNPVTAQEWSPARGTRVVPLDAGILMHTGHPNPGVRRVIKDYANTWAKIPVPVIVHLIGTTIDEVSRAAELLNEAEAVAAIELGLNDDIKWREAEDLVIAATDHAEKPVLVRLPFYEAMGLAKACADAGADALVVAAPPRGTARDPRSGRLVSGRVYGPLIKPMVLRMVGSLCNRLNVVPVIGAGGVHSPQDARDYLEAGAVAVQVDSVTWIKPQMIERIARDLSGKLITRAVGAFPDEWNPDMGDTDAKQMNEGGEADAQKDDDAPVRKRR